MFRAVHVPRKDLGKAKALATPSVADLEVLQKQEVKAKAVL